MAYAHNVQLIALIAQVTRRNVMNVSLDFILILQICVLLATRHVLNAQALNALIAMQNIHSKQEIIRQFV